MEGLTQGRGAVVFMTVMMYTQPGLLAISDNKANGDCGLRYVNVNQGQSLIKEAKNTDRWDDPNCRLIYRSAKTVDTLYLIFRKFDVVDCNVKLEVFFGAESGKTEYDCKKSPQIDKVYYEEGEYNLTMNLQKADVATEAFDIQLEITTNSSVLSPATSPVKEKMSLCAVLAFVIGALAISSAWKQ